MFPPSYRRQRGCDRPSARVHAKAAIWKRNAGLVQGDSAHGYAHPLAVTRKHKPTGQPRWPDRSAAPVKLCLQPGEPFLGILIRVGAESGHDGRVARAALLQHLGQRHYLAAHMDRGRVGAPA